MIVINKIDTTKYIYEFHLNKNIFFIIYMLKYSKVIQNITKKYDY